MPRAEDPGWAIIHTAVEAAVERLGSRLTAAYAIGSLGHGGFSEHVSDVDLALLVEGDEPVRDLSTELAERVAGPSPLSRRLSVFHAPHRHFGDPPPGTRFPAIDRLDLLDSGRLVHGRDLTPDLPRPARTAVVAEAVAFTAERTRVDELAVAADARSASKTILAPLRLVALADTGRVTGSHEAARRYHGRHSGLIQEALDWRLHGGEGTAELAAVQDLYLEQFTRLRGRTDVPDVHLLDPLIEGLSARLRQPLSD